MKEKSKTWAETKDVYGGTWEVQTACGKIYRKNLGKKTGLGFLMLLMLARVMNVSPKQAWLIAETSKFYRVDSLHGKPKTES